MRRYVVLHINPDLNQDVNESLRAEAMINATMGDPNGAIKMGLYQATYAVDVKSTEDLFAQTQSDDTTSWYDNLLIIHGQRSPRSTGLGDIAIDYAADTIHLCVPHGDQAAFGQHAYWLNANDELCKKLTNLANQFLRNVAP